MRGAAESLPPRRPKPNCAEASTHRSIILPSRFRFRSRRGRLTACFAWKLLKFIAYYRVSTGRQGKAGVDVRFADLPQIEGATGRFLLQQMVAVAELEAGMISARTKAALAAAKRRGVKLGGNRGVTPSTKMHKASQAAIQGRADARAADVAPVIAELQSSGASSLRAIADGLNARKIPTARGNGKWTATQVMRVLERNAPFPVTIQDQAAASAQP
jgi:Resolvase, N terminal domain